MVTISDEDIAYKMTIDASDYNSGIDESISKLTDMDDTATRVGDSIQSSLTEVQDAAEFATSSLSDVGNVDMSGTSGSMNDLSAATSETTEKAGETVEQFSILDAIELAAVIEGVHLLADALTECVDKFAELNDISTRSAIFGGAGTSVGSLAGTTDAITKQAEAVGLKLGVAPESVASMEGVLKQYQVDTSKMSDDQIGQYVALARTTQQDPSAVATEVLKTAKAFNIDDTQKVIDVAAQAYGQTGFDFSSAQMSLSKMAGDQTQKALGGITGEIAILQDLQQTSLPSRGAGVALNKAVEDWQNSSDAYQTQVEKINAKGKVSYSTKDVAATGMTDTATGQSIFSEAGLNTTLEKNKTFLEAMGDLYTQGQAKGVDYFSKMSGGMYLEELAKNQAVIQGYKAQNDNASDANDKLKNATDDLSVSLNRIGIAFDQVKTKIGSLLAGPAQAFADWITGPALSGITQIIDDIEKGDWDGAIQTIGDALGKIPGLVEKAIGDISIGDLLLKALGGAGGMIAGSDLVAMMGLPALIGGPMGALAGLAVGIIGTYLPQIISSFKNAVPGIVAEVNDWISSIIDTFSTTDFSKVGEDVGHSIFTSISNLTSDAATAIVNLFSGIDYTQVGGALYYVLKAGWNFAWGALGNLGNAGTWIQNWLNGSDFDLSTLFTGPVNALKAILGPTFEAIKLDIWGKWIDIGEKIQEPIYGALTGMESAASSMVWIFTYANDEIYNAFAKTFNTIDDLVTGFVDSLKNLPNEIASAASGSYDSLKSSVGLGGKQTGASTVPNSAGYYPAYDASGNFLGQFVDASSAQAATSGDFSKSTESGSSFTTGNAVSTSQVSHGSVAMPQPVGILGSAYDNPYRTPGDSTSMNNQVSPIPLTGSALPGLSANSLWTLDKSEAVDLFAGELPSKVVDGVTKYNVGAFEALGDRWLTKTEIGNRQWADTIDSKQDANNRQDAFKSWFDDNVTKKFTDSIDRSAYNAEKAAFDQEMLASAKQATEATKETGAKIGESATTLPTTLASFLSSFGTEATAAATTAATTVAEHIPGLYYGTTGKSSNSQDYVNSEGGYVGPTKYYPGYKDQQLSDMTDAQAINSKYGINGLGSVSMKIDADTTPAEAKKATLESDVTSAKPILAVGADTTKAMADINKLITWVITSRPVMTVQVQITAAADEIQAQVEAAIRKAAS